MTNSLLEIGEIVLATAERRLEIVSRNIANGSTSGFKKQTSFDEVLTRVANADGAKNVQRAFVDFAQGAMRATGRPLDLAIAGDGFFRVRSDTNAYYYTRNGEFDLGPNGQLINSQGMALQSVNGGDIILSGQAIEILEDGVILENSLPVGQIGLFSPENIEELSDVGGALFSTTQAPPASTSARLRQRMVESANVQMSDEMVAMMEALRAAEIGSKIIQTYDALVDKSISTFGKGNA